MTDDIGHNQPPADVNPIHERLKEDHEDLCLRTNELLAAIERAPEEITDENAGKVGDFIKQLTGQAKKLESLRVDEKEPYLAGGRSVDGFFKPMVDKLTKGKKSIEARYTTYLRLKEAEERRAREEAERKAREEEERLKREAEEAAKAIEDEPGLDAAVEKEIAARQAEAARLEAEQAAKAKASELSRTRGDYGSTASLRTTWAFEVLDIHQVPLDELRPYLAVDAVERAIRGFVKANQDKKPLPGVRIYEKKSAVVV